MRIFSIWRMFFSINKKVSSLLEWFIFIYDDNYEVGKEIDFLSWVIWWKNMKDILGQDLSIFWKDSCQRTLQLRWSSSPSTFWQTLSNELLFVLKISFYSPKTSKNLPIISKTFVKSAQMHSPMWRRIPIDRSQLTLSNKYFRNGYMWSYRAQNSKVSPALLSSGWKWWMSVLTAWHPNPQCHPYPSSQLQPQPQPHHEHIDSPPSPSYSYRQDIILGGISLF